MALNVYDGFRLTNILLVFKSHSKGGFYSERMELELAGKNDEQMGQENLTNTTGEYGPSFWTATGLNFNKKHIQIHL